MSTWATVAQIVHVADHNLEVRVVEQKTSEAANVPLCTCHMDSCLPTNLPVDLHREQRAEKSNHGITILIPYIMHTPVNGSANYQLPNNLVSYQPRH